jgi:hypothetical protein
MCWTNHTGGRFTVFLEKVLTNTNEVHHEIRENKFSQCLFNSKSSIIPATFQTGEENTQNNF